MVYNPATDFLALWRNSGGQVSKLEVPAMGFVLAALARAGVVSLAVSATPPVANQATTAWLQTAVPSYSAEGQFFLWDKVTTTYLAATPKLFLQFLEASAGESGASWWTCTGGAPLNTVGNNGDFAIRTDEPGGVYGPKADGAWPGTPLPGTLDAVTSTALDNAFGGVKGDLLYRDAATWQALAPGAANALMIMAGGIPTWEGLSLILDALFSNVQGAVLFRSAAAWAALPPGAAGQLFSSNGAGVDPSWTPRTAEFPSGTRMLFQQTSAPTGWTKDTSFNDYALRVTSGSVGSVPGTPFSTVFAQTAVSNTTLSLSQSPSHAHGYQVASMPGGLVIQTGTGLNFASNPSTTGSAGGDGPHTHSVSLALSYVDTIIASKN